jgi:hypothetical protein
MLCIVLSGTGLSACTLLDMRPQNLRGTVKCHPIPNEPSHPLLVKVILDEAAVRQHSRFEVIREVVPSSTPNLEESRLAVDVGSAMGAIDGCSTFQDAAFQIDITDQMISYPSWIRIRSRPEDSVLLIIEDTNGLPLTVPHLLAPQVNRFMIEWLR